LPRILAKSRLTTRCLDQAALHKVAGKDLDMSRPGRASVTPSIRCLDAETGAYGRLDWIRAGTAHAARAHEDWRRLWP